MLSIFILLEGNYEYMIIKFEVPGPAIGKQRPRFTRRRFGVATYTPQRTMDYQKKVVNAYKEVSEGRKLSGSIKADICAVFEPPKSASKKNRQGMLDGEIPYTKKPDIDNIAKSVLDGLNDIAYDDDSAVDEIHVYKTYGEEAKCYVRLSDNKHAISPFIFYK